MHKFSINVIIYSPLDVFSVNSLSNE